MHPRSRDRLCLAVLMAAVLFKFWLIWASEIADALDDPHEYVLQMLYPLNGGLAYPPGTGWLGRLFLALGLPFRLGIEALFMVATAYVLRALFAWPWKNPVALGLFIFALFDPTVADLFSRLGSDEGWLVATMLGTSIFVLAWENEEKPAWILMALAAALLGFSTITRSVIVPLELAIDVFAAVSIILIRAKRRHPACWPTLARLALGIWTLILGIVILYSGTCTYNSRSHGYEGISIIDSAEYKKFYLTLESVGEPNGERYFVIDHERRQLIAQAGPVSRWLMNELDHNEYYKKIGLERYGTLDVPSGWFEFAVFNAVLPATRGDLRQCYALFAAIEQEIDTAQAQGRLRVRKIIPLPDSRIRVVAVALSDGFQSTLERIRYEPPGENFTAGKAQYADADFTRALSRRNVVDSPARDAIWQGLDTIYAVIFNPALIYLLAVAATAFAALLIFRWYQFPRFPLPFLARQIYLVLFVTLIVWYAVFDASGRPVVPRYMIFNHLLLVPLIVYYAIGTVRLIRKNYLL